MSETEGLSISQRINLLKQRGTTISPSPVKEDIQREIAREAYWSSPDQNANEMSVSERLRALKEAQKGWENRIPKQDQEQLTVQGKLISAGFTPAPKPPIPATPRSSKPYSRANTFHPTPRSPSPNVPLAPPTLDEGLSGFWGSPREPQQKSQSAEVEISAFESVASQANDRLVSSKSTVKPPRRAPAKSKNPAKALIETTNVEKEYPTAEMRKKHDFSQRRPLSGVIDHHHTPGNKPDLAEEAKKALAAKEDFSSVKLKTLDPERTPGLRAERRPYREPMLILIKGRREVSLRLVAPTFRSLNSGDSFLLLTSDHVFLFIGRFSNLMERAKGREVGSFIVESKEMGCRGASRLVELEEESLLESEQNQERAPVAVDKFWALLGGGSATEVAGPLTVLSDEEYELALPRLHSAFRVVPGSGEMEAALVALPHPTDLPLSTHILQPSHVLVLDFFFELYVWFGRDSSPELRRQGISLAETLWNRSGSRASPSDIFSLLAANSDEDASRTETRPDWGVFGVVKHKMETSLFKGKFVDWRESSPLAVKEPSLLIGTPKRAGSEPFGRTSPSKKQILAFKDPSSVALSPEELAERLINVSRIEPDLVLEEQSVGRGIETFMEDRHLGKHLVVTEGVDMYLVDGTKVVPEPVPTENIGHFHSSRCYIVRWKYRISMSEVRALNGASSQHSTETGRARTAFFYWQGGESSQTDCGACALALRELDKERAPHVRVVEGLEPPAFLNLFQGKMTVHKNPESVAPRLFVIMGGPHLSEASIREVDSDLEHSLRSQGCYFIVNPSKAKIISWKGSLSPPIPGKALEAAIRWVSTSSFAAFNFRRQPFVQETLEGHEEDCRAFQVATEGKSLSYPKPSPDYDPRTETFRLFRITYCSVGKGFSGSECQSCWFSPSAPVPFPFHQDDLYGANQPAFFILDQGSRFWLWEGWVEEAEEGDEAVIHRLRLLRLFALRTLEHCRDLRAGATGKSIPAELVYAGMEPSEFIALFAHWTPHREAVLANFKVNRYEGQRREVTALLAELTVATHPYSVLVERPLPEGVDGSCLEAYLSDTEFLEVFQMTQEDFYALPDWKQIRLKKESQLF